MKVVLLLGPSSAGKSTLCQELKNIHKWKVVTGDDEADKLRAMRAQLILEECRRIGIVTALKSYMTEQEILNLATNGSFAVTSGEHRNPDDTRTIDPVQFPDPSLPKLDTMLTKAGFTGEEYNNIFRAVNNIAQIFVKFNEKREDLDAVIFNEAFKPIEADIPVIIDHVPDGGEDTAILLAKLEHRAAKYRVDHPESKLEVFIIFAHCSPEDLSNRILNRNREAELKGNLKEKREGLFPFDQLASLVEAGHEEKSTFGQISKAQLHKIAYKHSNSGNKETKTSKLKTVVTAARSSIELQKKFGLWKSKKDSSSLAIKAGLKFDGTLNTAEEGAAPSLLANKLIRMIDAINVKRNSPLEHKGISEAAELRQEMKSDSLVLQRGRSTIIGSPVDVLKYPRADQKNMAVTNRMESNPSDSHHEDDPTVSTLPKPRK